MIWKTAWKNVWRNKVRSLVVISSVTVGILAGVSSIALMNGLIAQRIGDALNLELSHIQITARDFRINNDPQLVIGNGDETLNIIGSVKGIEGVSRRTIITGMANSAYRSTGVQITGIDPEQEKKVLSLYKQLISSTGDYFEKGSKLNPVLIGEDLAKELNIVRYTIDSATISRLRSLKLPDEIIAKLAPLLGQRFTSEKQFIKKMKSLFGAGESKKYGATIRKAAWTYREGSKLTLTFLDKDNNQVGAIFRIAALYGIPNKVYEKSTVFVRNDDLRKLTGLTEKEYHEFVIKVSDPEKTDAVTSELIQKLSGLDVISWKKLAPDLAMMTDMVSQFYLVFGLIILAALAFGIINTMLMVVLERTRELGMLTAIGMNRRKVFSMIMLESVFLSLVGAVAGMALSYMMIIGTAKTGIDLSQYAEGFGALGYSATVYPQISPGFFAIVTVLVIVTGVLSSIYPAMKALKLNPVEAIRAE